MHRDILFEEREGAAQMRLSVALAVEREGRHRLDHRAQAFRAGDVAGHPGTSDSFDEYLHRAGAEPGELPHPSHDPDAI